VHNYMRTHGSEGATEPGRGGPRLAGPGHPSGRFGPPFLAPEGSSTLKPWRRRHSQGGEPFAPGGHPQARERGGRSTTSKEAPSRGEEGRHRRNGNHDQRCYVQHLDGVIFLFVHGLQSILRCNHTCRIIYLSSCVEYTLMLKVSYLAVKGVGPQCFLGSIQYAVSIIGLVMNTRVVTVREEGKGETVVTTPDRLDWFNIFN
jgi:hypothetical protein